MLASPAGATDLDPDELGTLAKGRAGTRDETEGAPPGGLSLAASERALIEHALSEANGNQTKAARLLGITRDTLRYRMAKFRMAP